MLAAQETGMGAANYLGGADKLATAAKPYMQAAQTGIQTAQSLMPQNQTPQAPQSAAPVSGMSLQQLAMQNQQNYMQQLMGSEQARMQRRQQRRGLV
jgi:hypothetical protein